MPSFELLSILDFVNCTDEAKALGSYMELLTNSQTVLLADWQIERGIPIRTLKLNEQKAVVEFGNAGDRKDEAHHVSPWINRPTISPMEQDPACPVLDTSFRYAPMPACGEPFVMPISTRPAAYPASPQPPILPGLSVRAATRDFPSPSAPPTARFPRQLWDDHQNLRNFDPSNLLATKQTSSLLQQRARGGNRP